jgi:hypothetical protein
MPKYTVRLTNNQHLITSVEADSQSDAENKAETIDWDYLIERGDDGEVYSDGLEVDEVEEE